MIKCKALEPFTLQRFNELKNIKRKGAETPGQINKDDEFECEKDLAEYLTGKNMYQKAFVEIIEVIPEIKEEIIEEPKPKKATKKKLSKK